MRYFHEGGWQDGRLCLRDAYALVFAGADDRGGRDHEAALVFRMDPDTSVVEDLAHFGESAELGREGFALVAAGSTVGTHQQLLLSVADRHSQLSWLRELGHNLASGGGCWT